MNLIKQALGSAEITSRLEPTARPNWIRNALMGSLTILSKMESVWPGTILVQTLQSTHIKVSTSKEAGKGASLAEVRILLSYIFFRKITGLTLSP